MQETTTEKHIVTQTDIDANPDAGLVIGDEIELPTVFTPEEEAMGKAHDEAIAAGKTEEEALVAAQEAYDAAVKAKEPADTQIAPVETKKLEEEETIVEPVAIPTVTKLDGKELMFFVRDRKIDGKALESARWEGEKLVVKTVENTEFTLTGAIIEAFLNS